MGNLKDVARAYFDGLNRKDLSAVPYADDAIMWAPLGPNGLDQPIRGKKAIIEYLEGVFPILGEVEVQNLFADGEWACGRAFLQLTNPAGAMLRVNDVFHVVGGEIVEQENHYDPRPALG
ncbi:MAG: nuclear transport factor 2 family protein [Novosphingobium sp.]|nr:nuclear transport factor 2 family protein [Novosphingobium sp.]